MPTMGSLHPGHMSLIEGADKLADQVVVSIYVNPTQFGPGEDFEQYPRDLESDLAQCRKASVAAAFCPDVEQMYPRRLVACEVNVPQLAGNLEATFRPEFFGGVCRVVAKLLNIVQPDILCLGEKDYQQLRVVEAMIADLLLPVQVKAFPVVREADGLAYSSRNVLLKDQYRDRANCLYQALTDARMLVEVAGETNPRCVETAMRETLLAHATKVDYAVLRDSRTLNELDCIEPALSHGVVALIAAYLGHTRMIDCMELGVEGMQNGRSS